MKCFKNLIILSGPNTFSVCPSHLFFLKITSFKLYFSSETLRFRSPIGLLQRCVEKDYKIPGHDVILKKDSSVWINAMSLHFDPKHYANPNVFDPEHFSKEARVKRNP